MSRPRRYLVLLLLLLIGASVLWGLARLYLSSQHVVALVASRLQAAYGAPVRLAEADIGVGSSSLRDLQVFESAASAAEEPWLAVGEVRANIPVWDLIKSGALPSQLTLTGAAVTLRFDKAGHLLTRIPKSERTTERLPDIKIEGGRITLRQEGRPDFVVSGVSTDLKEQNGQLVLTGTATDPGWGDWTVSGSLDRTAGTCSATLKTPGVHVTQAMLERLPFVPAKVWQQVRCEGDTPAELTIRFDPAARSAHYRVTLEPRATQVDVTSIDLHAEDARGQVFIEDDVVTLKGVQGRAADGEIKTESKLDFAHTPSQLVFKVDATQLDLRKLPQSWRLPQQLGGRLSGQADLQITIDATIHTNGSGQGTITGARIPGAPVSKPILLKLHSSGEGFHFSSPGPEPDVGRSAPWTPPALLTVVLLAPPAAQPRQGLIFSPAELVNWFGTGVLRGVDAVARAGSDLLGRLPKRRTTPPKPQEAPSYLEAQLELEDVDVAQLIKGLGVPVPFPITGRISFRVQVAFPLDTPRDLKTYRLRGTVTSPRFTAAGQDLEQVRARVTYADGVLRLEELSGRIPAEARPGVGPPSYGSFHGAARLEVIPQGDLTARLDLEEIPFKSAFRPIPKAAEQARGAFSGNVEVRVPAAKLRDIDAWEASGTLTSERLQLYGLALENATVPLRLRQGTAAIQQARGRLDETPLTASARLRLADPYRYTGKLSLQKADLAVLQRLSPEVRPPVSVRGQLEATADIQGTLSPFVFQTSGSGTAADLDVKRLKIGTLKFLWESDAERVKVADVRAHLYGGELSGSAVIPLRASVAGNVDARIQDLDVGTLSKDVPTLPLKLEGRATGRLEGTLSAAEAGRPREFTSRLDLQAPQLRVQGIPTERLRGSVDYRDQALTYRFEGETLGGRFHLNGQIPPAKPKPVEPGPEGRLRVEGALLGRLGQALGVGTALGSLRGVIDLDVAFRHDGPNREPVGRGRFVVDRLRWQGTDLSGTVRGEVLLTERELRLRDLAGSLGQGLLRGQIAINLRQINRSWINLAIDQVEASRLLAPWPALAARIEGPLQIRLRGTLGREWYGSSDIALLRGRVFGVDVNEWRLPFDWVFVPGRGSGRVDVLESTTQLALGRVVTQASLAWGTGLRLEGHARFFGLELRTLLRQATDLSQMGTGHVSGRFDFAGSDVRSLEDLTGTLDATLQQTQALQLPVLQQLTPFLIPGQSSAAVFQSGSLRARLARGVFRIERLNFAGSVIQLFIDGTVTLQGRLNLEVTANTGRVGVNPSFVRFLGLRLPAVGPIPVGLLMEASTYFSNRLVHLRVGGTLRSPVITVEPLSLLTEEALRFFVNRSSLPVP